MGLSAWFSSLHSPSHACHTERNSCRRVYARWFVESCTIGVGKDGSLRLNSTEYLTSIYTEHAPAVTWFNGAFRLATVRFGRYIDVYGSTSGSTTWGSGFRLNDVGWVSPPYFSPTTQCRSIYCMSKLRLQSCTQRRLLFYRRRQRAHVLCCHLLRRSTDIPACVV